MDEAGYKVVDITDINRSPKVRGPVAMRTGLLEKRQHVASTL